MTNIKDQLREGFQNLVEECHGTKRVELGEQPPSLSKPKTVAPAMNRIPPAGTKDGRQQAQEQMFNVLADMVKTSAPSFVKFVGLVDIVDIRNAVNSPLFEKAKAEIDAIRKQAMQTYLKEEERAAIEFWANKKIKELVDKEKNSEKAYLATPNERYDTSRIDKILAHRHRNNLDASGKQAGLHEEGASAINKFLDNKGAFHDTRR